MNIGSQNTGKNEDNTHRSLQQLVSVNAWFIQDRDAKRRFTLHADVSFSEERLGGGTETQIVFKLAVKRCDIIFLLPYEAPFHVDPSTVHSPRPLNPRTVIQTETAQKSAKGKGTLTLNPAKFFGNGEASVSAGIDTSRIVTSEQEVGIYHERWKMVRGNHAWSVDGRELNNRRLAGPVFDPKKNPRLTIIDDRSEETKARDSQNKLEPVACIQVRCLREDIDIYDIAYKNPDRQKKFEMSRHKDIKLLTAREILKEALLREGLVAGDLIGDPYAEMTICDVAISVTDSRS